MKNLRQAILILLLAALAAAAPSVLAKAASTPTIPHSISGREQCLSCHGAAGAVPSPASHATFTNEACVSCHAAATPTVNQPETQNCAGCHGQTGMTLTAANGETLSLYVDPEIYAGSIHSTKLLCTDCHASITGYPHPKAEVPGLREYNVSQYEICKRCHFDNYTKTLDSVHYDMLTAGNNGTPICTDCHGVHNITSPSQPRTLISHTCAECHESINGQYIDSVHGRALVSDGNNYDVPVCTDCHQSHTIEDPRTASFRIKSVDLCINCHSNEKLMQKYDISTQVVKTYLQDFHGASVALVSKQSKEVWPDAAVCTDCHGVHNIMKPDDPASTVIKENLVTTCQGCHPDASINFPGAWLSHYEPSPEKAPAVFYVRWFYRILIPFIIGGLLVHIMLDLWRVVTNR